MIMGIIQLVEYLFVKSGKNSKKKKGFNKGTMMDHILVIVQMDLATLRKKKLIKMS